jgi:hypothetical protein
MEQTFMAANLWLARGGSSKIAYAIRLLIIEDRLEQQVLASTGTSCKPGCWF